MPAYLDTIIDAHRSRAATDERALSEVVDRAGRSPRVRPFVDALRAAYDANGMAVVSEIKRRSPSKGDLDPGLDPAEVATDYQAGGAACLSVLTDEDFFGGCAEDLRMARNACSLPVLRKDFTVSALDVCDARIMGADAVLLIAAALTDAELGAFHDLAAQLSMSALVEVHDELELKRALEIGAQLVGVNQRDLRTFEVDPGRALALGRKIPVDIVAVAESGIRTADDVSALAAAGYRAVLVGETLVRSGDRRAAVAGLLGTDRPGTDRLGTDRLGTDRLGTDRLGTDR
jgi:indole-3-glycerol phosphate synthase